MLPFILFGLLILALLALDLGVLHKKNQVVSLKSAMAGAALWVTLAMAFNLLIYFWKGEQAALEFLAGYLIEESLSVDNLFVFLLIFKYFNVPEVYRYRVLFWGILGAIIMRALFIAAGIALVTRFHFVMYLFGAFLVVTGIKMVFQKDKELEPEKNPALKLFRRFFAVSDHYEEGKFFIRQAGRLVATPLFIVLLFVETTDLIFAVDSIPAVFGVTRDPFIVYTSNIFAIMGLRALFFALASMMDKFHYLQYGLSAILIFVGVKMLIVDFYPIPIAVALGVLALLLTTSVVLSLLYPPARKESDQVVEGSP
jgi:tellurite resistance protein TerC